MNRIPTTIICDVLSNLDNEEVEKTKLVSSYWKQIVEMNSNVLPRRIFACLEVNEGRVYGKWKSQNISLPDDYDSSIDSEEDPTHSWNFLEDENYIKLSSCYFESYDIFEKGKIDEEFELLQGLAKKSGHKIIISTIRARADQFEDLKKSLLLYVNIRCIALFYVFREFFINTERLLIENSNIKLVLNDDESKKFPYTVQELVDFMKGESLNVGSRYKVHLHYKAPTEFVIELVKQMLKDFRNSENPGKFVKNIHLSTNHTEEMNELQKYLKNQKLSYTSRGSGKYIEADCHIYQEKHQDGWKLEVQLTHYPLFTERWSVEISVLAKDEEEVDHNDW